MIYMMQYYTIGELVVLPRGFFLPLLPSTYLILFRLYYCYYYYPPIYIYK
jgi:hypothetical protein